MKIKIWGCRGSITTSGTETVRYGGNSTCLEIRSDEGSVFVIDAGSGLRNFGKALRYEPAVPEIRFFFTHSHWDHLVGFPFFEPIYSDRYMITFCNGPHGNGVMQRHLSRQMEAPYFPVAFINLKAKFNFRCEASRKENDYCPLGSFHCFAFPLSHPNGGHGFKFMEKGKTFVFLTDNELGFRHPGGLTRDEYVKLSEGADLLLHDAQYTDEEYKRCREWGHSTYRDAVNLAIEADVKRLGLFHHDPDRTDTDLDQQTELCREQIQRAGSSVECFPCTEGMAIYL